MSAYGPLAPWYDALTSDVPYEAFADYYQRIFAVRGKNVRTLLDLACGTGTLSALLARRGYEVLAVDQSPDMLSEAMDKFYELPDDCVRPMPLCQSLSELDLYGTSDAAVCCLDSLNYLSPEELQQFFDRLRYFLEPGGLLVFDINEPAYFEGLDGQTFVDEREDLMCVWRASLTEDSSALVYDMDVFRQRGKLWARESEEHREYIHQPEAMLSMMEASGWRNAELRRDGPLSERGRLFFIAENGWYSK